MKTSVLRRWRQILISTILSFLTLLTISQINVFAKSKDVVTFFRCVDGDTADFKLAENIIKVRFLAIDTPETVHPAKGEEHLGKMASDYTCTKIKNATRITLEYDPNSSKTDKYGRILAWVWVDDILLQKELITMGYAKINYIYGKYLYLDDLYDAQYDAQTTKTGLWQDYEPLIYTVIFDEGSQTKSIKITKNNRIDYYTPEKPGYIFDYWEYNNQEFDFDTLINEDITLKAIFHQDKSTLEMILIILIFLILFLTNKTNLKKKLKKLV